MDDLNVRLFAFDWLKTQIELLGDILPRKILHDGFIIKDERIGLVGPQGIWKPKAMRLPISITSIIDGPYPDKIDEKSGILHYKYRGTDPGHPDNQGLRELMKRGTPLIYFHNIAKDKYVPMWPVYIVGDIPAELTFSVMADDMGYVINDVQNIVVSDLDKGYQRRAYITATSLIRVHQKGFRERVLKAYRNQCTLCCLKHPELLDAAHIIADSEDLGDPIIQNGLALCKIHHAAFDKYIIGISPDFDVKVRQDILEEVDGPMLKHGLQSLNNNKLILPKQKTEWPDKDRLNVRYNTFLSAV
ncbi:MAG TPA: HNH endonuclease signature motif containing protein [Cyclobacteriaceae bacterium]|nr:HNH endonuclease signature motif containing protein [Cyclobacteriaceae bacterium]